MKNFLLLTLVFAATACTQGYETLSSPFNYRSSNMYKAKEIGSYSAPTEQTKQEVAVPGQLAAPVVAGAGQSYEVSVNAPAGTVLNTAVDMFHKEASKVCNGGQYASQITSQGTTQAREFLGKGEVRTDLIPTVKGIVTCK